MAHSVCVPTLPSDVSELCCDVTT